ncbi:hypothetical protein GJAV_G00122530 [Gymnothorax javanicus]|nr:hypothetical protein GJAV_G00122530 [Gymnothorax javanicus]
MDSRRVTTVRKLQKNVLGESNNSTEGSQNSSGNVGEEKRKKKPGRIVKSRYQQAAEKKPPLKTLATESKGAPRSASPKPDSARKQFVGTPPRRSLACQSLLNPPVPNSSILEPSILGGAVLQSTVLDGHCARPEFDISAIRKDKAASQNVVEAGNEREILENQTFTLAYLTAKMESNTRKFREEAEWSLLAVMEEEERLRKSVHEKRRQHLLQEKRRQLGELLDLQSAALAPVSAAAEQFTEDYRAFATALDTTRHELPVKNFYIQGNGQDFLEKAVDCLRESEALLLGCELGPQPESHRALELLSDMKRDALELEEQLSRDFSDVLELASLVTRQTVQIQQSLEETRMGTPLTQALYLPES